MSSFHDPPLTRTAAKAKRGAMPKQKHPAPAPPLHEQVAHARAAKGWSQQSLAAAAGVNQGEISRLEMAPEIKAARGRRGLYPSLQTLSRVARALKCVFVIDGSTVSQEPAQDPTVEPTTAVDS
jgi:transcriptional regulator with XRE-family HTH domain